MSMRPYEGRAHLKFPNAEVGEIFYMMSGMAEKLANGVKSSVEASIGGLLISPDTSLDVIDTEDLPVEEQPYGVRHIMIVAGGLTYARNLFSLETDITDPSQHDPLSIAGFEDRYQRDMEPNFRLSHTVEDTLLMAVHPCLQDGDLLKEKQLDENIDATVYEGEYECEMTDRVRDLSERELRCLGLITKSIDRGIMRAGMLQAGFDFYSVFEVNSWHK